MTHCLLLCLCAIHLQAALLLGTADFPNIRSMSTRPWALAHIAHRLETSKETVNEKDRTILAESRKFMVNNRMMRQSSCEGFVLKASAFENGKHYVPVRSEMLEGELLRKTKISKSDTKEVPKSSTVDLNSAVNNIAKGISCMGLSSTVAAGTYVLSSLMSIFMPARK